MNSISGWRHYTRLGAETVAENEAVSGLGRILYVQMAPPYSKLNLNIIRALLRSAAAFPIDPYHRLRPTKSPTDRARRIA